MAYSCLCYNAVQGTSLQTAEMTELKMRPHISINAWLAENVEWAEVEKGMLLVHLPPSPAVFHQCTDWRIRARRLSLCATTDQYCTHGFSRVANVPQTILDWATAYACGPHLLQDG